MSDEIEPADRWSDEDLATLRELDEKFSAIIDGQYAHLVVAAFGRAFGASIDNDEVLRQAMVVMAANVAQGFLATNGQGTPVSYAIN